MSKLQKLLKVLESQNDNKSVYNYVVPDLWNCFDYEGKELKKTPWGELIVNPYNFYSSVIKDYILPKSDGTTEYSQPLSKGLGISKEDIENKASYLGGDWIKEATVYSTMIRTSTAWDHDRSGDLEEENVYHLKDTGTFVKSLALLPLLKKMGITTVYMLPISKFSLKDKKGELGSPYGVSNFFELDPSLKDPITKDEMSVDEEFQAFVEACHILGMRVMIDIIPRTNSVNSDLIAQNPDWFYWIKMSDLAAYFPPAVPGLGSTLTPKPEFLPNVYSSNEVWNHIRQFVVNPKEADPKKWDELINRWESGNKTEHILDLVREMFGLTVAPAFSDHINDPQPPWSDVTFFRMYMDHPTLSKQYLGAEGEKLAPYILFDTIKSNMYKGDVINEGLWNTLSGVIPHYQEKFGIDGARIDMGHALPSELVDLIISRAREVDPDFCFIAEELYPEKADTSREMGYNMIIGRGFYMQPRIWEFKTHEYYYGSTDLACPVFAGGETHDTPRLAAREGGRTLSKMLTILNMFMPNGVPFINSGQEVYETQPMNTGLDCRPNEGYMLDPKDPFNGKLALFDKFALHYTNEGRWDLPDTLDAISQIRSEYITTFSNIENYVGLGFDNYRDHAIGLGYVIEGKKGLEKDNCIMIVANTDVYSAHEYNVHIGDLRHQSGNTNYAGRLLYSQYEWPRDVREFEQYNIRLHLQPGEVKIIKF